MVQKENVDVGVDNVLVTRVKVLAHEVDLGPVRLLVGFPNFSRPSLEVEAVPVLGSIRAHRVGGERFHGLVVGDLDVPFTVGLDDIGDDGDAVVGNISAASNCGSEVGRGNVEDGNVAFLEAALEGGVDVLALDFLAVREARGSDSDGFCVVVVAPIIRFGLGLFLLGLGLYFVVVVNFGCLYWLRCWDWWRRWDWRRGRLGLLGFFVFLLVILSLRRRCWFRNRRRRRWGRGRLFISGEETEAVSAIRFHASLWICRGKNAYLGRPTGFKTHIVGRLGFNSTFRQHQSGGDGRSTRGSASEF